MTNLVSSTVPKNALVLSTGYKPRPQLQHLHDILGIRARFMTLVFHRRAGKTVFTVNAIIDHALRNPLPYPKYGYVAPSYKQAKNIAWNYFIQYTKNIPDVKVSVTELSISWPRPQFQDVAQITLAGAENTEGLRGGYLDIFVLDEYSDIDPTILPAIFPSTSDRYTMSQETPHCPMSGLGIVLGTPKGQDHFFKMYSLGEKAFVDKDGNVISGLEGKFYSQILRASESHIISPDELALQRGILGDFLYNREFECSFDTPREGSYFSEQLYQLQRENRFGNFPHDPNYPVLTAWDLGISDSTAIWFIQHIWGMDRVIHYEEGHGLSLVAWADKLKKLPYTYATHLFPHDIEVREYVSGAKRSDSLRQLGISPYKTVQKLGPGKKADGIHAIRVKLQQCVFNNTPSVEKGFNSLRNHRQEFDQKTQTFNNRPVHDYTSHGVDAFQTFALGATPSCFIAPIKVLPDEGADVKMRGWDEFNYFESR